MKERFRVTALIFALLLSASSVAFAQTLPNGATGSPVPSSLPNGATGAPGTTYAPVSNQANSVVNPLGISSVCGLIKALLSAAIQIGIPIAVLFIVYAGFRLVWAQGNETKLEEAKHNLLYTFIGIGIFLGAWLLAQVIANTVTAIGGNSNSSLTSCQ